MVDLAEKVVSEMSDSDAFTTKLTATMKTNGVTSVEVDDIKADTTKVPTNAGTSGGEIEEVDYALLSYAGHGMNVAVAASMVAAFATSLLM